MALTMRVAVAVMGLARAAQSLMGLARRPCTLASQLLYRQFRH